MKKLICLLLALCMLPVAALAESKPVKMEEIIALKEKLAALYAELAEKEAALAEMQRLYRVQNSNRRIVFEEESLTMINGRNMRLSPKVVRVKDDAPKKTELRWGSSDSDVVWIDRETGRAYAKGPGTAVITCWASDDDAVSELITITVVQPVESVRIEESTVRLFIFGEGESALVGEYQLYPEVSPANASDRTLTWTIDNEKVVSVSESGLLTAATPGTATVTAAANDGSGKKDKVTVKVYKGAEAVQLNYTEAQVRVGKKLKLEAIFTPSDAGEQTMIWHSSDESIAEVTTKGYVTGVKPGVCVITATTTDGSEITVSCTLTVTER